MSSIVILWVGFKLLLKHLGEKTRKLSLKLSCDIFPVLQFIYALLVMFRVVPRLQKCFSIAVMWSHVTATIVFSTKENFLIAKTETCMVGKLSKLKLDANPGLLELRLRFCRYRTFSRRLYLSFYAILQYILICRYCYLHFLCLFHCCLNLTRQR